MRPDDAPQVVIGAWLMASSVVAGLLVLLPWLGRLWANWLWSSNPVKRVVSRLLYFQAAFLGPFCIVFLVTDLLLRIGAVNSVFLSAPWQARLLSVVALIVPLWVLMYKALLRHARSVSSSPGAT
jgi:hypothetical protein